MVVWWCECWSLLCAELYCTLPGECLHKDHQCRALPSQWPEQQHCQCSGLAWPGWLAALLQKIFGWDSPPCVLLTLRVLQRLAEMEDWDIIVSLVVIELRMYSQTADFVCWLSVSNILIVISHPGCHVSNLKPYNCSHSQFASQWDIGLSIFSYPVFCSPLVQCAAVRILFLSRTEPPHRYPDISRRTMIWQL